jgi:Na+/melibiose symporter-like transporter
MQRIIGVVLGAIVCYLLLLVLVGTAGDSGRSYGIAVIAGAIVAILWPWIVAIYIGRRVKERRDEEVQREVDRALEERKGG